MADEGRFQAVRLLIEVLRRVLNPAEHADIEAWIDLRSADEGGFLWLAATMNVPPRWLDSGLRSLLEAPACDRAQLRKRLRAFSNAVIEE